MSYCRWSSDDFECDIYAFHHVHGTYEVWVASRRHVSDEPKPASVPYPMGGTREEMDAFWEFQFNLDKWLEKATQKPIGLPCDGEQFSLSTPLEAAEKMEELKAMGYNVPQRAIDALREEAKEDV